MEKQAKKRRWSPKQFFTRHFRRLRAFNRRLKPPFKQIIHGLLYFITAIITLLLIALIFFPALQVFVAGMFSVMLSRILSPAFMVAWLPVRVGRKLVTFSLSKLLRRTRYYRILSDRVRNTVLFPAEEAPDGARTDEAAAEIPALDGEAAPSDETLGAGCDAPDAPDVPEEG